MPKHIASLQQYGWPGNVRELQNVIERAVITYCGGSLQFDQFLPEATTQPRRPPVTKDTPLATPTFVSQDELKQRERPKTTRERVKLPRVSVDCVGVLKTPVPNLVVDDAGAAG